MIHAETSERQLLTGLFDRELGNAVRMLRSFPAGRDLEPPPDCPLSARELAWGFLERARLVRQLAGGREPAWDEPVRGTLAAITAACEGAHGEIVRALHALPPRRWNETLRSAVGYGVWERGRRGQLLWMVWKDLAHHGAHFELHLRLARHEAAPSAGAAASL